MDMKEIGSTIRAARKQRGLTQEQLGTPLGMSRATISGLETGNITELGVRKIMAICASLGLELQLVQRRLYPTLEELRKEVREKRRG